MALYKYSSFPFLFCSPPALHLSDLFRKATNICINLLWNWLIDLTWFVWLWWCVVWIRSVTWQKSLTLTLLWSCRGTCPPTWTASSPLTLKRWTAVGLCVQSMFAFVWANEAVPYIDCGSDVGESTYSEKAEWKWANNDDHLDSKTERECLQCLEMQW